MRVRCAIIGSAILLGTAALVGLPPRAQSGQAADTYSIDPVHSSIVFRVKHMNTAFFYGRFNDVHGTLSFDEASPTSNSIEVEIKTDSIDTNNTKRDADVKGADWFNVAKFPTMSFKSKSFTKTADNTFDVAGDLTLHGQTKPITVKLEKTGGGKTRMGEKIGFETVFTFKRSDYGMTFMPDGLGDEVKIMLGVEAGKK